MIKSTHILKMFFLIVIILLSCQIGRSQSPTFISRPIKNKVDFKTQKKGAIQTVDILLLHKKSNRINIPKVNPDACVREKKSNEVSGASLNKICKDAMKKIKKRQIFIPPKEI